MMRGTESQLHSFGKAAPGVPGVGKADKAACDALNGSICPTSALVAHRKTMSGGRMSSSTQQVEGDGCLPRMCTEQNDLTLLASFLRSRAREVLPGQDVEIELSVNCTGVGGSAVSIGGAPAA